MELYSKMFFLFKGWNDGSFNEFQNNWDEQIVIPGGVGPGSGNDYDTEQNGLTCYSCDYCNVEPFKPEDTGVGTKSGCHVCSKEWDDGMSSILTSKYVFKVNIRNLIPSKRICFPPKLHLFYDRPTS